MKGLDEQAASPLTSRKQRREYLEKAAIALALGIGLTLSLAMPVLAFIGAKSLLMD